MMFGFVYPGERGRLPASFRQGMLRRFLMQDDLNPPDERVCQGTLISREQYLPDLQEWGYADARITQGYMTPEDVAHWTAAIKPAEENP